MRKIETAPALIKNSLLTVSLLPWFVNHNKQECLLPIPAKEARRTTEAGTREPAGDKK
jgi:hypothetical protein